MRLVDGKWEPYDALKDWPDDGITTMVDFFKSQGWEQHFSVGDNTGPMWIETWRKRHADGTESYLIEVNDQCYMWPVLRVDSTIDLLDLLARWAPLVQTATITDMLNDLHSSSISDHGVVETIAARVLYGMSHTNGRLLSEKRNREQRARECRAGLKAKPQAPQA